MTAPRDPQRFLLSLRDADPARGLLHVRLRRALKCLLRSFGLRCDRAEVHPFPPAGQLLDVIGEGEELLADEPDRIDPSEPF